MITCVRLTAQSWGRCAPESGRHRNRLARPSSSFLPSGRGADDDQDALRLVLQTRLQVDAVRPDIDVALADRTRSLHRLCSSIQTSFSRPKVVADKPAASLPSKAASAWVWIGARI